MFLLYFDSGTKYPPEVCYFFTQDLSVLFCFISDVVARLHLIFSEIFPILCVCLVFVIPSASLEI